jgi:uncharacterized Rossmann fold enzyme
MNFEDWNPVYEAVLRDFGFPRAADEAVRDRLVEVLTDGAPLALEAVSFAGETVAIAGAGPSLDEQLSVVDDADSVVAASAAADVLRSAGRPVDCMVTDLDKTPATARDLSIDGVPVAVHAHGDNRPAIEEFVPTFATSSILPTTQAAPADPVVNTGGFTDGDRAAFLADHLGATRLVFPGWDFDDDSVSATKRRKLGWAERLLYWLERRREERFAVLDGRRDAIDTSALPIE